MLCPLQLGSVKIIHQVRKCVLCLALEHWANIWSFKLLHVFCHVFCAGSLPTNPKVTSFISALPFLSRLQPYGTEPSQRDKNFSLATPPPISIHLCACITTQVLSPILGWSDSHLFQQLWAHYTQSALLKIGELHWGNIFFFFYSFASKLMRKALKPQLTNDLFLLVVFSLLDTLSWARREKRTRTY